MQKFEKILALILLSLTILIIFYRWFLPGEILSGDWPYFYEEALRMLPLYPPSWSFAHGNGLGGTILLYNLDTYLYFVSFIFVKLLHVPWEIVSKIFWFASFIFISIFSSIFLFRTVTQNRSWLSYLLVSVIYTTNTYILMVVTGGQMGVAIAYAILPAVIASFLSIISDLSNKKKENAQLLKKSLWFALFFSFELFFDLRLAFIASIALFVLFVIQVLFHFRKIKKYTYLQVAMYIFALPLLTTFLLNAFWLIPMIFIKQNTPLLLGVGENLAESVKFFSFANFSDTIALLHPNWPENIFGKTFFMRPEFLLLPLLVFGSLFFITKIQKQSNEKLILLSLLFIGLLGVFLAKGAKPPFEEIYIWAFKHVPGFIMFRDSTKFYVLIALVYAVVIPFFISFVSNLLSKKLKMQPNNVSFCFSALFLAYWLFVIYPAVNGQLKGTFEKKSIPEEYIVLNQALKKQPDFSRILWVPRQHRFTMTTPQHPSVEAYPLFQAKNNRDLIRKINSPEGKRKLAESSIKYVIVPYDIYGEIFIDNRKYSSRERDFVERELDKITWLKKVQDGNLTIYQTESHTDHFSLNGVGAILYSRITPYYYKVDVDIKEPSIINFSENYHSLWSGESQGQEIVPQQTPNGLQVYLVSEKGKHTLDIYFKGDRYYIYGKIITGVGVLLLIALLVLIKLKKIR